MPQVVMWRRVCYCVWIDENIAKDLFAAFATSSSAHDISKLSLCLLRHWYSRVLCYQSLQLKQLFLNQDLSKCARFCGFGGLDRGRPASVAGSDDITPESITDSKRKPLSNEQELAFHMMNKWTFPIKVALATPFALTSFATSNSTAHIRLPVVTCANGVCERVDVPSE